MIAPRTTAPKEIAPVAVAGYLQLAGLLIIAIAAREIESSGGGPGDHPLMLLALLAGVTILAGASFLRRYWKQATGPSADLRDEPEDFPAREASAFSVRGRDELDEAAAVPVGEELRRWQRHGMGVGSTDSRRATERESGRGAGIGTPR